MSDQEKHREPRTDSRALGDNPFADMDTLEWLGIESPPAPETPQPEPKIAVPPEDDTVPAVDLPDDEAERALQEWLREEKPPETPPDDTPPAPDAQAQLLARLLAEQNPDA
jgi:hypothetical protein